MVAQIVFKLIDNPEDRKDIAQDVYLKVFKNLSGFKFQSKLSTWIAQISYNTCISHIEKKKLVLYDPASGNEETDDHGFENSKWAGSTGNETEVIILRKQQTEILTTEIEKLPPLYRTLITLFHNEEMSYEEIGEITGLPEGTLKSYLFRARKTLKNNLLVRYKKEEL